MQEASLNLSTDMAMAVGKNYFKQMAQSFGSHQLGVSLWTVEDVEKQERIRKVNG